VVTSGQVIPAAGHPDSEAVDVLAGVLGDTPSGRLYKALVEAKKAVGVGAVAQSMHDPGFFLAMTQAREEQSLDDARDTMIKVIEGVAANPPTKEEVDRVKTRLLKEIDLAMADTQGVALYLSESAAVGDWRLLFLSRDRLRTVTEQDVLRVAKAYFKQSNRTVAQFVPTKNPDRAPIDPRPDLTTLLKDYKGGEAIAQGEAFEPTPANVESRVIRSRLSGGLKLALLSKKTRGGIVNAQLTIHFGDEKTLFGKSTAAAVAGSMLMRGTKNRSRQQIEDEIDRLKAQINVDGGLEAATADIQTTEANLSGALRLAAEMLREPSFPEAEFEQVRQQMIAGAERSRPEPGTLAQVELQRHLWPYPRGDARYVSTPDEDIAELKALTLDDVKNFYKQFYGVSTAELVVVGQFETAPVQKLASELFGN
jgi:zinc protease